MRLAILYICTGRYAQFFLPFYRSCESFFLPQIQKTYFVWTDDTTIAVGKENVRLLYKEASGFPNDSLFRFEMFLQAQNELESFDYIYFFNSNALFLQPIYEDILPDESGLAIGIWPGKRLHQHPMFYPYERNKESLAYIKPFQKDYHYFMGGINGGTAEAYLNMIKTLSHNIRDDYNRGIIACVHDESHINRYLRDHPCKILDPIYSTPEEYTYHKLSYTPKIIFRDKVKIDPCFDKGRDRSLLGKAKKGFRIIKRAIQWYI